MTAQLSREDVKELRNSFQCWQQDYDPKEDAEQYEMFGRAITATDMLLAGMDSETSFGDHMTLIDKGRLMMLEDSHQTLFDYRAESVWYWQGDEDDQPESLSCPVIMSAETLRELLAKAAPPAPVAVPDEIEPTSGSSDFEDYYCDGWNACRAAMLKAGPVTGWIKCSERMPEEKRHYIVWVNASKIDGYCDHTDVAAYQGGGYWSNDFGWCVTHWMPLPAAPEQEV